MPTRSLNVKITTDTKDLAKGRKEAEKEFDKIDKSAVKAGASIRTNVGDAGAKVGGSLKMGLTGLAAGVVVAGAAVGAAFVKGIGGAMSTEDANNKLQAQLGLNEKESARLGKLAGSVYASNYGDSLGEVNGAIKNVVTDIDGLGKASGNRLKGVTGDVISLSKAFDQDLGGVTRAVGQQMRTGLAKNAQEALDVITVGFQNGADKSGDFLDTLNEYGTQFRKLGLDGKTATGLISQGLKAGARDGDLVADSLKEFSIRAVDGSETTKQGFAALGLDAEKMSEKIGKGGVSASKGLDQTLDRLRKIEDPVKRSQAAVQLFGTQAEDLGDALFKLDPSKAVKGLGDVAGAARKVNNELGDSASSKIEAFKRQVSTGFQGALARTLPTIGNAATALSGLFHDAKTGSGVFTGVSQAVDRVKDTISRWVTKNRSDIDSVIDAFTAVGNFAKHVFQDTLRPIIERTIKAIGPILEGLVHVIRGLVRTVTGLFSGDWDKAWSGAKEAVGGAWRAIKSAISTGIANAWELIKDFGPDIVKTIAKGLKNLGSSLLTGFKAGVSAAADKLPGAAADTLKSVGKTVINGIVSGMDGLGHLMLEKAKSSLTFVAENLPGPAGLLGRVIKKATGDGIGKTLGSPAFPAGLAGGSLMGAKSIMSPFVSMAGRFGLNTSSGLRPGAITSSGNPSFHGSGNAVDEAGPAAGMLGYFRYLKAKFGSVLRELIYTPGGQGIKDGKPFTYTGQVAADHFDHVHVAFTGGAGDGIGRVLRSGDGIGDIKALWTREGGSPAQQNMAAAIAMAESGGNAGASNRNTDGSIDRGLWQINSVHGALSTFDREGNAKAAVSISSNGRNWNPWVTFKTGAYKKFLGSAAGTGASGGGGSSRAGSGSAGAFKTAQKAAGASHAAAVKAETGLVGPGQAGSTYAGAIDLAGLQRAEAGDDPKKVLPAVMKEINLKLARLAKVKSALKKRLTAGTRSRLMQEATQLIGELADLWDVAKSVGAKGSPPSGIVENKPDTADASAGGADGDVDPGPSIDDFALARVARARLTEGASDDIDAVANLLQLRQQQMDAALADGDPRNDEAAIDAFLSVKDSLDQLTKATEANTSTLQDSLTALTAEMKRQTDYADQVQSTSNYQLTKTLADLLGGFIVGRGVAGRAFTPGSGVEYSY